MSENDNGFTGAMIVDLLKKWTEKKIDFLNVPLLSNVVEIADGVHVKNSNR